jgi:RND family efflux transporter MFP subunit
VRRVKNGVTMDVPMSRVVFPKFWPVIFAAIVGIGVISYVTINSRSSGYITTTVTRTDLTQEVLASGNVASPKNIDLQFQNGGKVTGVFVESGHKVEAGQILVTLDTSVLEAQHAQALSVLAAQKAQLATILEGTRPEQLAVTQAQIASDQIALSQSEQSVLDALQNAYSVSDSVVKNTVDQFFSNPQTNPQLSFVVSSTEAKKNVESERAAISLILATWSQDIASLIAQNNLLGAESLAQQNLRAVAVLLNDANAALSSGISGNQVSSTQLNTWMSTVATARTTINTAISTLTSATTARRNAEAALAKDQKTLALQQAGSTSSTISAQQAQVDAAQANVAALKAQLSQMRLLAPLSGTITNVNVEVGETVSVSTIAVTMIPESQLQIDLNLSEDNVANAEVGDPAHITLDAFGSGSSWQGTVIKIDPAQTIIGGAVYYKTTVNFNEPDSRVKPGMTANVWIQTGAASSTLVVPASALIYEGAKTYVQVLENGTPRKQSVSLGLKSQSGLMEVLSGLREGEKVVIGN